MRVFSKTVGVLAALACAVVCETAAAADPYKIGFMGPLSGSLGFLSRGDLAGLQTYFDTVNAAGGINGRRVEIISRDDTAKVEVAITHFRQFGREQVLVVAGNPISSIGEALARDAADLKLPLMGYGPTTDRLLDQPNPWVFSTGVRARAYISAVAGYVKSKSKAGQLPRVAVLAVDTAAAKQVRDIVEEEAKSRAPTWQVVGNEFIPLTATDANAQMASIAKGQPDYVILWNTNPQIPMIINAARASGIDGAKTQIIGAFITNSEDIIRSVGPANYGYDQINLWPTHPNEPAVKKLVDAAKRHGRSEALTDPHFTQGWIMGMLIREAIAKCKAPCTSASFRDALETVNIGNADGLAGPNVGFSRDNHEAYTHHRTVRYDAASRQTVPNSDWIDWRKYKIGK